MFGIRKNLPEKVERLQNPNLNLHIMLFSTINRFLQSRPINHLIYWTLLVLIGSFIFSYQQNFPYLFLFTQPFGSSSGFSTLLLFWSLCAGTFLSAQRQVLIALLFLWCLLCAGFSLEIICQQACLLYSFYSESVVPQRMV